MPKVRKKGARRKAADAAMAAERDAKAQWRAAAAQASAAAVRVMAADEVDGDGDTSAAEDGMSQPIAAASEPCRP